MEEVTLTQEQLEALTEGGAGIEGGGVYYTYLAGNGEEEGSAEAVGGAGAVVVGGGSASELEGEDDGEQQQQILINQAEGQEVFVLDQGRTQSSIAVSTRSSYQLGRSDTIDGENMTQISHFSESTHGNL